MRFSKRHKSRRMNSLQKVGGNDAKDGNSLGLVGDDTFCDFCGLFGKTDPFGRHIHDISSKKDQGSHDNDQTKSLFFVLGRNGSEVPVHNS